MADGNLQGDRPAVAVAHEIGAVNLQITKQSCSIVCRFLEAERTIDVRGAPVASLVEGNHLPGLRKGIENIAEGGIDRRSTTVQQDQRRAGATDLVVDIET